MSDAAKKRLEWFQYALEHNASIKDICEHFGISRTTFHRWATVFDPNDPRSLESLPTTPSKRRRPDTPQRVIDRIEELRRETPLMSKEKIAEQLAVEDIEISASTVGRVIQRHHFYFANTASHRLKRLREKMSKPKQSHVTGSIRANTSSTIRKILDEEAGFSDSPQNFSILTTLLLAISASAVFFCGTHTVYALEGSVFEIQTNFPNQATTSPLEGSIFDMSGKEVTNLKKPLTGSQFQITTKPATASSSSTPSETPSVSTDTNIETGGGRREETLQRLRSEGDLHHAADTRPVTTDSPEIPTQEAPASIVSPQSQSEDGNLRLEQVPQLSVPVTGTDNRQSAEYDAFDARAVPFLLPRETLRFFEEIKPATCPKVQEMMRHAPPDQHSVPCAFSVRSILLGLLLFWLGVLVGALTMWILEHWNKHGKDKQKSGRKKQRKKSAKRPPLSSLAIALVTSLLVWNSANVYAATTAPLTHVYNGNLTSNGTAVTTAHTIRFSYWKSADYVSGDLTGTGAINTSASNYVGWYEEHTVTPNSEGAFAVELGSITSLPTLDSLPVSTLTSLHLQIEVKVSGASDSTYDLLDINTSDDADDRTPVLSVPFAQHADTLDQRDTGTGSGSIPVLQDGGLLPVSTIPGGTNQSTFTINADGSSSGAVLQFGQSLIRTLRYDHNNSRFNFNTSLRVQGQLTVTGSVTIGNYSLGTGTGAGMIRWTGTDFEGFDGSTWNSLTSGGNSGGGNVVVQEGDTTVVQTGATLDLDASDFDVTESPANEANISLSTDGLRTRLNDTYVNTDGDTMTGNLSVQGNISGATLNVDGTITLNGVAYTWPDSSGALNQFLTTNGDGTLSYKDINDITQITGSIASGDEVLIYDASIGAHRKISRDAFLSGILGALVYQGTWNANTNSPSLSDGTGTKGYYYVVSTGGTQDLGSGNITFAVSDYVIHNGSAWEKLANVDTVSSVFGRQGAVTAQPNDYSGSYIRFDNADSGLSAINVQDAIDEIDTTLDARQSNNDARYINQSGDTMTGNLVIGNAATLSVSGAIITQGNLTINQDNGAVDAILTFGNDALEETLRFNDTTERFEFSDDVHATGNLTASGTLSIEGAANIHGTLSGNTISGFNLSDCDNATTSKLLWDETTKTFSCGTDTDTDTNTTYSAGQGITINGTTVRVNSTLTGVTLEFQTLSGSTIHAQGQMTTSGSLIVEEGQTITLNGVTYTFPSSDGTNGQVLTTNGAGTLTWQDDDTGTDGITQNAADDRYVNRSGDTMTGNLIVGNGAGLSASGTIATEGNLTASGTLSVEGTTSLQGNTTITGTLDTTGAITTDGNLTINHDNSAADAILTFGNDVLAQTLRFSATTSGFIFSTDLEVQGTISGSTLQLSSTIPASTGSTLFNSGGLLYWQDDEVNTIFNVTRETVSSSQEAYDVTNASFVDSFSVNSQDTTPRGFAFSDDGKSMFVIGGDGTDVNHYDVSTAFDVSSASYAQNFSVNGQDSEPTGIAFNTAGTKMIVVGGRFNAVYEYTLSSGYDVSTASYVDSFSVSGQDANPIGIAFNNDGTKMFITGNDGDDINEYTLSTGYDVSTASFVDSFSVSTQETVPTGIAFNGDGTKMYITGDDGDDINVYTLGTGFDVSTALFTTNVSVSAQETAPYGIRFNDDGTKVFILGDTGNDVNEYTIPQSTSTTTNINAVTLNPANGNGRLGIGTDTPDTRLEVVGTASGRTIHAQNLLTTSGSLVIEEGNTLTINGNAYTFPQSQGSSSGGVLRTNASGTLSWGLIGTGSLSTRTKRIILPLRDATIIGDGSSNEINVFAATQTGSTSNIHHYFRAETGSGQLQDIDIRLKVQLPQDFVNFTDTSNDLRFSYKTSTASSASNKLDILVEDDDGDDAFTASDGEGLVNTSWTEYTDEFDGGSFNPVKGEYIYITVKTYASANASSYAGEIVLTYTAR